MIKLSKFEKNKEELINYINEDTFEFIKKDSEIIKKAHSQLIVYNYFNSNYIEYSDFIKKTSNIPVTIDIRFLTSSSLLLQANKLIFNLLFSFKFFIDNTRAFLTRKYRDNTEIISNYELLINEHYDNHFYYRFLTKLRDYAVHIGFPLQGLTFSAEKNELNPEKMIGKIQLLIELELIKKEKSTFKKMDKELLVLADDIDLNPLINSLIKSIDQIQSYVYSIQKKRNRRLYRKSRNIYR